MFPLPIHIYFEAASLLACILLWPWLKRSGLKYFLPYLSFIVIAELMGRYLAREMQQPNAWLYNFVVPIEYLFFSFIFYIHYSREWRKKTALAFFILFTCYAIGYMIVRSVYVFNVNFLLVGSFFMIVLSILSFIEMYDSMPETPLLAYPLFWISAGILIFNAGEFSYNLMGRYLINDSMDPSLQIFREINNKLILVLYSCFIIAFICQTTTGTYKKA